MKIKSPVVPGLENYEIVLCGKDAGQEQYEALPALRSPEGITLTRWSPSKEERKAIAAGADIYISSLTFNQPFQALKVEITDDADPNLASQTKREMRLDDDFELRQLLNDFNKASQELQEKQLAFLKGNADLKALAEKTQQARLVLERKKAQVFTNETKRIAVVQ